MSENSNKEFCVNFCVQPQQCNICQINVCGTKLGSFCNIDCKIIAELQMTR